MTVEIIRKDLTNFNGEAWLIRKGNEYYVVSGADVPFSGWEVLIFPSDENGVVTNWGEVAGGRGISHEEAIKQFDSDSDSDSEGEVVDEPHSPPPTEELPEELSNPDFLEIS
jgi:hypothetical protein